MTTHTHTHVVLRYLLVNIFVMSARAYVLAESVDQFCESDIGDREQVTLIYLQNMRARSTDFCPDRPITFKPRERSNV